MFGLAIVLLFVWAVVKIFGRGLFEGFLIVRIIKSVIGIVVAIVLMVWCFKLVLMFS